MFAFWTQIITVLLFIIGSQRSLATPTLTTIPLEIASTENLEENIVPQEIEEKGENPEKHHWECQAESDFIQKQIALTSKLLSDGEKAVQNQKDLQADETVLVLGKAGSGKTSLVQFLTQNPKLQSKIVEAGTGEYIIEDGEKIGTSATESFTLYPELVNYNSTISFCDSPGFHDSRSSAHEIVSMDVMKSTISQFKRVKILLLENYSSLQYGLYKDNFIDTLHHLNDFLNDIDRYKDNIVLIASKVPRTFFATDDIAEVVTEVTDEMHIEAIMKYLNLTEASIAEKLNENIEESKNDFYRKVIKLLQSLQTRDEDGKATRVNVFRRPYKSGPLTSMTLLKKNKESLTKTIIQLDSVDVLKNDFDFTLSNEAKMYLECLLKLTSDNYKNKINEVSFKLSEFVDQKVQNYTSFSQMLSELELLYSALKQLSENLEETRNYNEFFEKISGFITDQKIPLPVNYNERLHVMEKYEEMLSKFVNTSTVFIPSSWTHPIRQVIRSTKDELQWYRALNKFIGGLSNYERQKNKTEIYSTVFHNGSTLSNGLMTLFMEITESTDLKQFVDALSNSRKKSEVEAIPKTLLMQNNITCDADGKLIVKGFHVILSEINTDDLIQSYCHNITVKEIALLAVDTVFIDEDSIDVFKEVSMFVAAPKWEVIGQRRIVLSGQPGPTMISDAIPHLENGQDGRPGFAGGNGGSFFGIGSQFLKGENLYIESNGGRGGPGSDGAKGAKGANGLDAKNNFELGGHYNDNSTFEFIYGTQTQSLVNSLKHGSRERFTLTSCYQSCSSSSYYSSYSYNHREEVSTDVKVVIKEGVCGEGGNAGGLGGEAGLGGFSGDVQLIELGHLSQIKIENQNGSLGTRGKRGENGEKGKDGIGMICVQVRGGFSGSEKSFWKCETTTTSPSCKTCPKLNETSETFIQEGIEQPKPKKTPDFVHYLLDYAILLEAHVNNTIFRKIITDFKAASQKQSSYNLNEMGLLYFKKSA